MAHAERWFCVWSRRLLQIRGINTDGNWMHVHMDSFCMVKSAVSTSKASDGAETAADKERCISGISTGQDKSREILFCIRGNITYVHFTKCTSSLRHRNSVHKSALYKSETTECDVSFNSAVFPAAKPHQMKNDSFTFNKGLHKCISASNGFRNMKTALSWFYTLLG